MRILLRGLLLLVAIAGLLGAGTLPGTHPADWSAAHASDQDAECTCEEGYGACQAFLHCPWGETADPCWCDRCREFSPHDGQKVPRDWNSTCFTSPRSDCYLKRHSVAWNIACSECVQNTDCCKFPKKDNCPDCETGESNPLETDALGKPAKATVLARLASEQKKFKKPEEVTVLYNRHFYVVSDIGGVKVKMKGGSFRLFNRHEWAHLTLERAEIARRDFVRHFGDRLQISKPVGIFLPEKERDAQVIQATYFGSPRTNQLYGGSDRGTVADGFCFNGFCQSGQKFDPDETSHMAMRHMIGHSLVSCWVLVDGNNRALPRWLFEGAGHWLSKLDPRFRDMATFCSDEGPQRSTSGKDWENDCARMASGKLSSIEELFGKTALGLLSFDDQKRAWSYLDLCLKEWREPFVKVLEDIRQQKELRDTFMQNLQCTPEIFDERWRERVTGKRRSMAPGATEDEPEANDTPSARERRALRGENDVKVLAARVRALGTVDDPKTVDVVLDLLARDSELVRESVTVALMKLKEPECLERIWRHGLSHGHGIVRAYAARACGRHNLDYALATLKKQMEEDSHWMARAEAALACGMLKDANSMAAMRKIVTSDPAEKTRLAAMDALAMFGEDGHMAVPLILKHLASTQWQLRVAACQALGKIGNMEAVEPLIVRMEQETGRIREEIRDALKEIVRDDLGMKPEHWRAWWEREKGRAPGGLPKRPDLPPAAETGAKPPPKPDESRYGTAKYYGIEIYSSRIGFVLDTSLSMDTLFEPDPRILAALSRTYTGQTKLQICKEEISQTLRTLHPQSHFSLIVFNTRIQSFKKNPIPSTPGNLQSAESWLRNLPPAGETNYYDGLRAALDLDEGQIDDSPNFRSTPDTLTFLTDGMPTQGEITDSDTLLEWYTSINRYARIRTHVIAFGNKGVDIVLLRGMAERNAGRFVHVIEKE